MSCVLAIALLAAADAATMDASLRTEGRALTSPTGSGAATALQIDALLGVASAPGEWSFAAAYSPRLSVSPASVGPGWSGLHGAQLGAEYRLSSLGRIFLRESFQAGLYDFSPLAANAGAGPPLVLDPRLPTLLLLAFVSSSTSLGFEQALSRTLRLNGTLGFLITGGSDRVAQDYIPLQRGPQLAANLSWSASRADAISLALNGSYARFTNLASVQLATLQAGWRHDLDRDLRTELAVGGGSGKSTSPAAPAPTSGYPSLSASLARILPFRGGRASALLAADVVPTVDRLTGGIYELGEGRVELGWTMDRLLNLVARGSLGRGLSGATQRGVQLARAEAFASLPIGSWAALSLGARGAWQRVPSSLGSAPLGFEWAVFSSLIVQAHERT